MGRRGLAKFRLLRKTSCWLQLRNNEFIIRNLASRGKTPTLAASFSIITYQGCASRYNLAPRVVLVICRRYGCRCKEPKWPWARDWSRQGNLRNWGGKTWTFKGIRYDSSFNAPSRTSHFFLTREGGGGFWQGSHFFWGQREDRSASLMRVYKMGAIWKNAHGGGGEGES